MSFKNWIRQIEKGYAWGFIGVILAFFFGLKPYFDDKDPNLQFIVESNTPVLDVKKDLESLEILYKGINIKEQNEVLRLITIRVYNKSDVVITKNYYDDRSPLKIKVKDGSIVDKPQLIRASNDYLTNNADLKIDSSGSILLPDLIIEGNQNYLISLLIIHKKDSSPKILSFGKIAGQTSGVEVIQNYTEESEVGLWETMISGNIFIHLLRFIVYIFVFPTILFLLIFPISSLILFLKDKKKKGNVLNYKNKNVVEASAETDAVFEIYLNHSNSHELILTIQKILNDEDELHQVFLEILKKEDEAEETTSIHKDRTLYGARIYSEDGLVRVNDLNHFGVWRMKSLGMISMEDEKLIINQKFKKELNQFAFYLNLR